jgi:hypothetical protein
MMADSVMGQRSMASCDWVYIRFPSRPTSLTAATSVAGNASINAARMEGSYVAATAFGRETQ